MADLSQLIEAYTAAQEAYDQNREDKLTFSGIDRAQFMQAEQRSRWVVAELERAKSALCLYVLEHRAELETVPHGDV